MEILSEESIQKLETLKPSAQAVFLKWFYHNRTIKTENWSGANESLVKKIIKETMGVDVSKPRITIQLVK